MDCRENCSDPSLEASTSKISASSNGLTSTTTSNPTTSSPNSFPDYDDAFPGLPSAGNAAVGSVARAKNGPNSHLSSSSKSKGSTGRLPPVVRPSSKSSAIGGWRSLSISFVECRFSNIQDVYRVVKELNQELDVKIDLTRSKEGYSLSWNSVDEKANVVRNRLQRELLVPKQDTIDIPQEYHGLLLGRNGQTLRSIETTTGAKIKMPKVSQQSDTIQLFGTKEALELAKKRLKQIYQEQLKRSREELMIPKIYHPFIYGAFNQRLDALKKRHNVKVNMNGDLVTVMGDKERVHEAADELRKIYEEIKMDCDTMDFDIPKTQHRYISGQRGSGLSDIMQQTGVSVELPPIDVESNRIILRGPAKKLGLALSLTIAKAESVSQKIVQAPVWLHRFIIGRQGNNLQTIIKEYPQVRIDFPDNSGSTRSEVASPNLLAPITVEGPKEDVNKVVEQLDEQIQELRASKTFVDLKIAPQYLSNISDDRSIGRIQRECSCVVRVLRSGPLPSGCNVRIEGHPNSIQSAKKELETLATKWENECVKEMVLDRRFRTQVFGSQGIKLRDLRDKYPLLQIQIPEVNSKSDVIILRGPREDVETVAMSIQKTYCELANLVDVHMELPESCLTIFSNNDKRNHLIRSIAYEVGGAVEFVFSRGIVGFNNETSNSQLQNQNRKGSTAPNLRNNELLIRGPKEPVDRARTLLTDVFNMEDALSCEETVICRPDFHPILIGKAGSGIDEICQKSGGARVSFPVQSDLKSTQQKRDRKSPSRLNASGGEDVAAAAGRQDPCNLVTIIGNRSNVKKAKELLTERIQSLENAVQETCVIPQRWHRHFMARRGKRLEEISKEYGGVQITFPPSTTEPPNHEIVSVKGPHEYVKLAIKCLQDEIDQLENEVTIQVPVPRRHYRQLRSGRFGDPLHDLQQEFHVNIRLPNISYNLPGNDDDFIVSITGRPEGCEAAKAGLLDLLPVEENVPLLSEYHGLLIGPKGQEIQALQREYNVIINITSAVGSSEKTAITSAGGEPEDATASETSPTADKDFIQVKGTRANIELFKGALAERVKKWKKDQSDRIARSFETKMSVPAQYRRSLLGQRYTQLSKLQDMYDVSIHIPSLNTTGEATDDIIIRGYEAATEKAKEAIRQRMQYIDSFHDELLNIPHEIHNRLIGYQGGNLKKIQSQYNVEIIFPALPRDAVEQCSAELRDTVHVIGPPDQVDQCCDFLIAEANEFMSEYEEKKFIRELAGESSGRGVGYQETTDQSSRSPKQQLGFQVVGGPYRFDTSDQSQFPSIGSGRSTTTTTAAVVGANGCNADIDQ